MLTGTVMDFRRYAAFTGTIIEVSALRRDYWYSYRRFGVTPLLLVNSYRRFGLMSRLLEQLSTFRRYAVLTGTVITFRPYAVFTGTVIDVSALRRAYWYIYRRFGVTPCSLVQLSTFRKIVVPSRSARPVQGECQQTGIFINAILRTSHSFADPQDKPSHRTV